MDLRRFEKIEDAAKAKYPEGHNFRIVIAPKGTQYRGGPESRHLSGGLPTTSIKRLPLDDELRGCF